MHTGPTPFALLTHTQPEVMLRLRTAELAAAALTAAAAHDAGALRPAQVCLSTCYEKLCQPPCAVSNDIQKS
jgi:hypothetical protein